MTSPSSNPIRGIFFQSFPLEIRNMIYELLLLDPGLAEAGWHVDTWERLSYHPWCTVYPDILGTCHAIYDEAYPILYHRNTFSLFLPHQEQRYGQPLAPLSPLNSHLAPSSWHALATAYPPAFRFVRRWKVVLVAAPAAEFWFQEFCHWLSKAPPTHLQVASLLSVASDTYVFNCVRPSHTDKVLNALEDLSGLTKIQVRAALPSDFNPTIDNYPRTPLAFGSLALTAVQQTRAQALFHPPATAKHQGLVCYKRLCSYAQTFELNPSYKQGLEWNSRLPLWSMQTVSYPFILPAATTEHNPFVRGDHPVEKGLAKCWASRHTLPFLPQSNGCHQVLLALEPQYLSILAGLQDLRHAVAEWRSHYYFCHQLQDYPLPRPHASIGAFAETQLRLATRLMLLTRRVLPLSVGWLTRRDPCRPVYQAGLDGTVFAGLHAALLTQANRADDEDEGGRGEDWEPLFMNLLIRFANAFFDFFVGIREARQALFDPDLWVWEYPSSLDPSAGVEEGLLVWEGGEFREKTGGEEFWCVEDRLWTSCRNPYLKRDELGVLQDWRDSPPRSWEHEA